MRSFKMLLHRWTMLLHRATILQQCFAQVIFLRRKLLSSKDSLHFPISAYFEGGFSHEGFPYFLGCIKQHYVFLDYYWVTYGLVSRAHSCPS